MPSNSRGLFQALKSCRRLHCARWPLSFCMDSCCTRIRCVQNNLVIFFAHVHWQPLRGTLLLHYIDKCYRFRSQPLVFVQDISRRCSKPFCS